MGYHMEFFGPKKVFCKILCKIFLERHLCFFGDTAAFFTHKLSGKRSKNMLTSFVRAPIYFFPSQIKTNTYIRSYTYQWQLVIIFRQIEIVLKDPTAFVNVTPSKLD